MYIDEFNPSCVNCTFLANYNIFGLYRELFFIVWPSPFMYVCLELFANFIGGFCLRYLVLIFVRLKTVVCLLFFEIMTTNPLI